MNVIKRAILFVLLISTFSYSQSVSVMSKGFIYENAPFPSCHASTLAQTPSGLVAAWFGGKHEKNPDVEIYFSKKLNNGWTKPISVANGIQHANKRYPCWNPVLFQIPNGPLLLFYKVGPDPSHWWGEMKESNDGGNSWTQAIRLPEDILGPIKNKPVLLSNGTLLCPSSKETEIGDNDFWQVYVESTSDYGKTWEISPALNDGIEISAIQPSILTHPGGRLQLLCRGRENKIVSFWSDDEGQTWSKPTLTELPNPNSGTDAVTLANGLQLLVYNPTEKKDGKWGGPRSPLSIAVSKDGIKWSRIYDLEVTEGEYSYPTIIEGKNGSIHITYTHNRSKIMYVNLELK